MTKSPIPTETSKMSGDNTKTQPTPLIADRLSTESLSNGSRPTGLVKIVYGIPTFPLTVTTVYSN